MGREDIPAFLTQQPPITPYREDHLNFPPPNKPGPAPYQRTGDPQFSHSGQPPQIQGATIPPASKLPPPKLTSHSLALLNVFKDENHKTPQNTAANLAPASALERKPSPHQDQLLNLLRGSPAPAISSPAPVELAADSTPPVVPQILQRSRMDNDTAKQRRFEVAKSPRTDVQTSATVSGPLNMPQFEGIAKPAAKKGQNGSNRKPHRGRQAQAQAPTSPVTILPRPQGAKKDRSSTPPTGPQASGTRTTSHSRGGKGKPTEPQKPFQPQILRRPEKPGTDSNLPLRSKAADDTDSRNVTNMLQEPGRASTANVDRRPSQTSAQKEALLSLFNKKPEAKSSPSTGPLELETSAAKPPDSSVISPLSPSVPPSIGGPVSGRGTPAENDTQPPASLRGSSPDNKAFLLGFLQGVAKGNK